MNHRRQAPGRFISSSRSRRDFLRVSAAALGSFAVPGTFGAVLARAAEGAPRETRGYGPLSPVKDESTGLELLKLPPGFRYLSYGWRRDPLTDGTQTPGSHDGMAVIDTDGDRIVICRNHEVSHDGESFGKSGITFDGMGPGGCTNLVFNTREGRFEKAWPAIAGTLRNCAGGPTPWGTWLTCEETTLGPGDDKEEDDGRKRPYRFEQDHGWIFEVPADRAAAPVPLRDMGRFVHEAIGVDPETNIVYETEDRGDAGLYRFLANVPKQLAQGGRLQMMKVVGRPDVTRGCKTGDVFDTEWVDIEDPTRRHSPGTTDQSGVFQQGQAQGGTRFARLEGCWFGNGLCYVVSTSGGEAEKGQIWEYDPRNERIRLLYESPNSQALDAPDNICVSPRGGIVVCEDGDFVPQRLHGLTRDGRIFPLADNHVQLNGEKNGFRGDFRDQEWCGSCFSPDGKWLFANIQTPGITFAITGPWEEGSL
jgi:uncharacterized protein